MTFDLRKIIAGKRTLRRDLAARPIVEKLRWLDALRERTIRGTATAPTASARPVKTQGLESRLQPAPPFGNRRAGDRT